MNDKSPVSNGETVNPSYPERKTAILKLQRVITEGRSSGPAIPFDPVRFKQKMRKTMIDLITNSGKMFIESAFERQIHPVSIINLAFLIDNVRWNRS